MRNRMYGTWRDLCAGMHAKSRADTRLFRQLSFLWRVVISMMIDKVFPRENNGAIDLIRQSTVTASDHHEANNEFAEGIELSTEGCIDSRIPKTETNIGTSRELVTSNES